jgi:hypothetical protein
VFDTPRHDPYRFAHAVADIVGRTRSADLHREVRTAVRAAPRWRPRDTADAALAAVLLDGPRRLALVGLLTLSLLLGQAPMPVPPVWALVAGTGVVVGLATAHVVLGGGRIRYGDRTRWASAAIGEVFSGVDVGHAAPRRWLGAVATVVVLNVAVALRGMSDRWTHGLRPMATDDRVVLMLYAIAVVAGALYTLRTMPAPQQVEAHLVSRRLEERTARQSAMGAAVCVGVVGLLAGVLPGGVDAADRDPVRIEQITDHDTVTLRFGEGRG